MAESAPVKHDWYQTETHVTVAVLLKNMNKDDVRVECQEEPPRLKVTFPGASGEERVFSLDLAHHASLESSRTVPSKIEVKLKKKEGIRWATLEKPAQSTSGAHPAGDRPPKFPTDWDRIVADISKSEDSEKAEGEAALNALFQDIYMKGSDETKRAMNKSFQESGGTVLSTNWQEVEKDKITVKAPDGMEWKAWN